jgi:hypothetical protein
VTAHIPEFKTNCDLASCTVTDRTYSEERLADVKASKQRFKNSVPGNLIRGFQLLRLISELQAVAEDDKVSAALIRGIEIQYNTGPS